MVGVGGYQLDYKSTSDMDAQMNVRAVAVDH